MHLEEFYVRSRDGVAIQCFAHGCGEPVLLVHGLQRCADIWFPLIGLLPGNFRYVMPNLRGRGGSGCPDDPESYLLERFVDDAEAVVMEMDQPVSILGWSMGASVGWGLSGRSVASRVARWIFVSGSPDSVNSRRLFPDLTPADLQRAVGRRVPADGMVNVCSVDVAISAWKGFRDVDFLTAPPVLNAPSLIIHGDKDRDCPVDAVVDLARLTGSELVRFEGAGHSPMKDEPELFVKVVSEFLLRSARCTSVESCASA
ncbi:alpha/beta fold hydrolase [Orrella marina]|uniref:AB hydrolase-1 domain-containing protein n=1 Tax=Orrella marina TaxID=2163011 RepID=A0A2R4XIU8_9BURK|nr:alpha/beta hydrolase [Orrella marina]AWB33644.1 hypothetical protein DBV39_07940 [Orrella marina]